MDLKNYEKYIIGNLKVYAAEKVKAGTWKAEEALDLAQKENKQLLPEGLETKGSYFYTLSIDERIIGYLWFAKNQMNQSDAFIYDFAIEPEFQNKGFGTQALEQIFIEAKKLGFEKISLHVFGSNQRAIHVYHKLGFFNTDINMSHNL